MESNGVSTAAILTQTSAPAKATRQDAQRLGEVYRILSAARKDHRTAVSDLEKGLAVYSDKADYSNLIEQVHATGTILTQQLLACRKVIAGLPSNTTGPGGANLQTVVMEFYGPVNRDLKARMTPADAKRINKAAFGNL